MRNWLRFLAGRGNRSNESSSFVVREGRLLQSSISACLFPGKVMEIV
jgi:hypothetical protein